MIMFPGCENAAKLADFGDLSDATFPTRLNTSNGLNGRPGPYHFDTTHEWIGPIKGTTTVEPDALDPDMDMDDGMVSARPVEIISQGISPVALVSVLVGTDADTEIRYLNVAADFNNDGKFQRYSVTGLGYQHEWIAVNLPVLTSDSVTTVSTSFRLEDQTALLSYPCMRATLSTVPIDPSLFGDNGWDGSGPIGGFERGETEDWCPTSPGITDPIPVQYNAPIPWTRTVKPAEDNPVPVPWPPYVSGPDNPPPAGDPPGFVPYVPVNQPEDVFPPEGSGDAPGALAEPASATSISDAMKDSAHIKGTVPANLQTGDADCAPTAAANSIQFLLSGSTIFEMIRSEGMTPYLGPRSAYPNEETYLAELHSTLKEIMTDAAGNGGMNDAGDGGTTVGGFVRGKKKASDAIAGTTGVGIETSSNDNPTFDQLYEAIKAGKDVEIMIGFYSGGSRTGGHYVVVTGVSRDQNGNLTITFVDPVNHAQNEVTFKISNKAHTNNGGGLVVRDYPGAPPGQSTLIETIFSEKLK